MNSPELHELAEKKAKLSLEVSAFRRELDGLKGERGAFVAERREEALAVVGSVMEAAHRLLSEARDAAKGVESYTQVLRDATDSIREAREDFKEWRDREEKRLAALSEEVVVKAKEMSVQVERLSEERMKLKAAHRDMELISEQARKDTEAARKERRKLMENKKFMDEYGRNQGSK